MRQTKAKNRSPKTWATALRNRSTKHDPSRKRQGSTQSCNGKAPVPPERGKGSTQPMREHAKAQTPRGMRRDLGCPVSAATARGHARSGQHEASGRCGLCLCWSSATGACGCMMVELVRFLQLRSMLAALTHGDGGVP